ncbi:MAG: ribose 5-phosphate isomerase B [Smithellaceae bacterium]|nr:ribose 5-phosphate isomerase B [Smithellaceae bacterium]
MEKNRIIIGADHAGFALKETIKTFIGKKGMEVTDAGTDSESSVDYPDFGARVASRVSSGEFPRGILICSSGVGMSIVANKFPRVRAVLALDEETARMSRLHNDTNILVLAAKRNDEETAFRIADAWLEGPYEAGRHARRVAKIMEIEERLARVRPAAQTTED